MLGQRKLLQRLIPGLMHAFIFWGFIVLFPTIVIAMIGDGRPRLDAAVARRQGWYALLVDVFAVLVLLGVVDRVLHPQGRSARRASTGSHLGEADLILALIAGIVVDAAALARLRIALGLNE